MLDLIYTGHADLAWEFFDMAWNPSRKDKADYLLDFRRQLAESEYWPEIEQMNAGKWDDAARRGIK